MFDRNLSGPPGVPDYWGTTVILTAEEKTEPKLTVGVGCLCDEAPVTAAVLRDTIRGS